MNIEVRAYEEGDFDQVNEILQQAFGYPKIDKTDERVYEFVALLDQQIVGYFQLMEEIDVIRDIKIFHVGYVCVDSDVRGQGVGQVMMEFAENFVREHHGSRMELTSGNQRVAAHRLYEKMGFEKRDSSIFRKELV